MRYRFGDRSYAAASVEELVRQMRQDDAFSEAKDDASWMMTVAHRVMVARGKVIRSDSAEAFVGDMVAAQVLTREEDQEERR